MVSTLARASMDGAILVAAVWVLSRILRLTPATRTMLWWCAAAKFVVALAWTTPIAIPVLPRRDDGRPSCRTAPPLPHGEAVAARAPTRRARPGPASEARSSGRFANGRRSRRSPGAWACCSCRSSACAAGGEPLQMLTRFRAGAG